MRTASVLLAALLFLAGAAIAAPPAPDALGPYAVGRTTFPVVDSDRVRSLLVDVWYPVDPGDAAGDPAFYELVIIGLDSQNAIQDAPLSDAGPFPLVVFSHGNGGLRFQSLFLTEVLASHGFVVIAPDHSGNTLLDFLITPPTDADIIQSALDRPQDVSFLISLMLERGFTPGDFFHGAVHPVKIGVAGHSFGGFTSLVMAAGFDGEAADVFGIEIPDDFEPIPTDPRVKAIVPIAPASTPFADSELRRLDVPMLLLGGTLDETTPVEPEIERPWELAAGRPLYRADLVDAAHFSFTNVCDLIDLVVDVGLPPDLIDDLVAGAFDEGCAPDLLPVEEAQRLTNLYTVAFFRTHLANDGRYRRFLRPMYTDVNEPDVDFRVRYRGLTLFQIWLLRLLFGL